MHVVCYNSYYTYICVIYIYICVCICTHIHCSCISLSLYIYIYVYTYLYICIMNIYYRISIHYTLFYISRQGSMPINPWLKKTAQANRQPKTRPAFGYRRAISYYIVTSLARTLSCHNICHATSSHAIEVTTGTAVVFTLPRV